MHADHREDIQTVYAGDIAAVVGLKNTFTGDTLCDPDHPIVLETINFPEPVISVAIEPKTKQDQDKMGVALVRLAEEDPTFRVRTDHETGQTIISGMGELHLEIIVDRMMREFKVEANVGRPQVAYRETIQGNGQGRGPLGAPDRWQGPVRRRRGSSLSPLERGSGYPVREQDRRRHGAARVHPGCRAGRARGRRDRRHRRLSGRRRQGDALRWLVPRG